MYFLLLFERRNIDTEFLSDSFLQNLKVLLWCLLVLLFLMWNHSCWSPNVLCSHWTAFKIFSLSILLSRLIKMCVGDLFSEFILPIVYWVSWIYDFMLFINFTKLLAHSSSNNSFLFLPAPLLSFLSLALLIFKTDYLLLHRYHLLWSFIFFSFLLCDHVDILY